MKSMNRVFLMGYLGRAPELQISKSGKPYTRLNIATKRTWLNGEDKREEKTDWHSVFLWGPLADHCAHTLRKGALVFVEGSLTYWQVAQDTERGEKGYKNAIHGHQISYQNPTRDSAEAARGFEAEGPDSLGLPPSDSGDLDNPLPPLNHNAVAHPA